MSNGKILFGVALVVLGVILMLGTLDIIDVSVEYLLTFFWPVALIILGAWLIIRRQNRNASAQAEIHINVNDNFIPPEPPPPPPSSGFTATKIISSDGTVTKSFSSFGDAGPEYQSRQQTHGQPGNGKVKYNKFVGDMFIDLRNVDLHNVEISGFLGDTEVKLHGAKLGPGLNRLIISGFIGDVRVLVPPDLPVLAHCSSFIGDLDLLGRRSSGLGNTIEAQSDSYATSSSKLYIATNNFIGDVRIYSV